VTGIRGIRAAVMGAAGLTGGELLRLLMTHPASNAYSPLPKATRDGRRARSTKRFCISPKS
jgi:N-acetyl-gamma-glutamylphosphate reductase